MVNSRTLFDDLSRMIAQVARDPTPIAQGMGMWLDYCQRAAPECEPLWQQLRQLDFEKDAEGLTSWLMGLFTEEPPPKNINGLWFGLHNPILDDGKPSCRMYIGGSSAFDCNSEANEWACHLSYNPSGRYSTSTVLRDLYRQVEAITDNNISYLGEPFLCHGYLALVVSHWCNGPLRTALLGEASVRAVVIGHDSGDFYRIAVLRR